MYDDSPRKGKPGGGLSMDAATAAGLAAVWPEYFPEESEFAADGRSARLAADLVYLFSSPDASDLLSRIVCASRDLQLGDINKINIRLYNHTKTIALKNLKAAYIKKLVTVRGTVLKVSTVKPLVLQLNFQCMKCATKFPRVFCDGKFSPPVSCSIQGCKSRTFIPMRSTAKIQELASGESHEEGRVPRTIECELTEDLVDCCIPGEIVTVTGIVKVLNNYMDVGGGKSKSRNQGLYYLYLEAISVRNSKIHAASENSDAISTNIRASGSSGFQAFTEKDLEFISKFKEEHGVDVFRQILQSFCPSIYGHELVKAGITLALFGGVQKHSIDQNKVPVRGDIHAVVVGDPGLGKSQLLQAAAAVSPRGIYVCGNTTTNAGLTVAVVRDSMSNDYAFEAGAMVLADRGICCIDEFDKMSAEHQALLEAMEQQCVSVAKAGLVASLSARTSVLAAANPVGGHYDRAKTVNENLKMSAALLSRFDLVFILLDKPDELLDKRVSDHIIALHSNDGSPFTANKRIRTVPQFNGSTEFGVSRTSLASRLRLHPEKDKDFCPLPGPLLRKYISYARSHVNPRISMPSPAADSLQTFYLELRKQSDSVDGTPITARQLESLVRLAEARARVDLREEVTLEDAKDVIDIMTESLYDKCVDEHGVVDFARSGGMSNQKQSKNFLRALNEQCELQKKDCFSMNEMYSLADRISLQVANLDAVVESLNNAGYIIKKGSSMYQVMTSSYQGSQATWSR
uniref:Probable DNA helicase MCM8 n=1 Tax=Oryza punctata TaxID=4537 RepID=A0A0E0L3J5_ORYPU